MAKIFGLDIPAGLEFLFQRTLTFRVLSGVDSLMRRRPAVSQATKNYIVGHSLFKRWQPIWSTFEIERRNAWQAYWITLPFGSHSGENGWPGSGYSAFVYINAPRFAEGLDLLLDPPSFLGPELIPNADFSTSLAGWTFEESESPYTWVSPGYLEMEPNTETPPYIYQLINSTPFEIDSGEYYISLQYKVPSGAGTCYWILQILDENGALVDYLVPEEDIIKDGEWHTLGFPHLIEPPSTIEVFARFWPYVEEPGGNVYIDFYSMKKFL